jgi:hypothetical protein
MVFVAEELLSVLLHMGTLSQKKIFAQYNFIGKLNEFVF